MDPNILLNNPNLKNINPEKLSLLMELSSNTNGKSAKDLLPILLAANSSAKDKGIEFNASEKELIVDVLKQQMSPDEQKKADMILNMMKTFKK